MKTQRGIRITFNGQVYYATWKDPKGQPFFAMAPTMLRAIQIATFATLGK
ncbi:MAG: hypothetical protein KBB46_03060 [Candidatus Pacebacteria bacterium]|nr:hypothetical protein [Candidatus Paceibacterota bacterium]